MNRPAFMFALLVLTACEGAPSEAPSPMPGNSASLGTGGSGAPPGTVVVGTAWFDATGALVAINTGTAPLFIANVVWWLDVETGDIDATKHQVSTLYYAASDCSGQARIDPPPPRQPFKVPGETAYRWRPHTQASSVNTYAATRVNGGACTPASGSLRTIPLDGSTVPPYVIKEPNLSFVGPLRIDRLLNGP
jgi:hypothetical protein